jgi:GNAT superfamily N-acetyltransferase
VPLIEPLTLSDLARIGHLQPEGWDDITGYFRFYLERSFCTPVKVEHHGEIVGVGSGIGNGRTGWLAHIIVAEDSRGKGLGKAVTLHLMDMLERSGCESRLLIATALGEPLYRRLGFRTSCRYRFYQGGSVSGETDPRIRNLEEPDLPAVLELDLKATGEDRTAMLVGHLEGGSVLVEEGRLRGFHLPALAEGPVVAEDPEAGCALLHLKHSRASLKAILPEENGPAVEFLERSGFELRNRAPRMVHGNEDRLVPGMIFSRVGGHYG